MADTGRPKASQTNSTSGSNEQGWLRKFTSVYSGLCWNLAILALLELLVVVSATDKHITQMPHRSWGSWFGSKMTEEKTIEPRMSTSSTILDTFCFLGQPTFMEYLPCARY